MLTSCGYGRLEKETRDITLVIPGRMAEGFTLGEKFTGSDEYHRIDIKEKDSPLPLIFKKGQAPEIKHDEIFYSGSRVAVLTNNNIITGIAGLRTSGRVTDYAVRLSDGADNFIMNYGNSGLYISVEDSHRIYLYKKFGIAVFDDYSDNSIDMYLIFNPEE